MSQENNTGFEQEEQALSIRELWSMCVSRWSWFVGSIVVCLLVATIYILKTPPVYSRQASILIKEDPKKSNSIGDVSAEFANMGLGMSRLNVNNEIISFSSPDLMTEVVKRLHLETNYAFNGGFFTPGHRLYKRTLYGSTLPMQVEFLDLGNNDGVSFVVTPEQDGKVTLKDFNWKKEKYKEKLTVAPGDTVQTVAGRVILHSNPYFTGEWNEDLLVGRGSYYGTARRYLGRLSIALADKNATVVNLTMNDVNTQRAVDVLNMLVNVYNEQWIKDKNLITTSTNEFIAERLRVIEKELGSVDNSISDFKSRNRMPDLRAAANMDMQLSVQAKQQITEINNQISIARYLLAYIRDSKGKLLPANTGLNDGNIASVINEYNNTLLQRNRLAENSSEENYLVKDMDQQLASMSTVIISSIENFITAQEMLLQSYQSTQSMLDARVVSNPQQAGQLLSDERQQKVKEALYLFLLQKREENELSQAFIAHNNRVITMPGGGSAPISPKRMMILLVALVMGVGLPFGFIYFLEITNNTVRGRKDLENMSAPFVGEIPATFARKRQLWDHLIPRISSKDDPMDRKIVVKPHSRDVVNEAFRVVRTNLEFMRGANEKGGVFMFTSVNPGSGKTFICSNLSTAFAIKGRKVIAVDLDLRKKSLSLFAGNPKKGVSNYLAGKEANFHPLIVKNIEGSGLDILPMGTIPPNPSELLSDPRLESMISELRKEYEYIFLDCPPVEIVTDADIVNRFVDSTLFIIRAGVMDRSMIPEVERYYRLGKYKNMCLILNGSDDSARYGYKYGYKYGYRFGGAYGHYGSYGSYYGSAYGHTSYGNDPETED